MVGIFVLFLVTSLLGGLLGGPKWLYNGFAYLIIISTYVYILKNAFELGSRKVKYNKKLTLYNWLDDLNDFDELLVHSLKRYPTSYGTIENLKNVKRMLVKRTMNDKSTLKMYKVFYKQKLKESGEELYLKTIMLAILPAVIALFGNEFMEIDSFQMFIYATTIILVIAFISLRLSQDKKRNGILVELIDLCIQDLEDEEIHKKNKAK